MRLMKFCATFGIVGALVSGCALEAGDERIGEVEEHLPFSLTERGRIGPKTIHASQNGWVEVELKNFHLEPAGCSKVLSGLLVLVLHGSPNHDVRSIKVKPDGLPKLETFGSLAAGDYEVALDPIGEFPMCHWVGDVFLTSH
jgi:hypothetical protein